MMDDYCTVLEAAQILGVSRQSVYSLAKRYDWDSRKLGPARLFLRSDVLATPRDESTRRSESQQKRREGPTDISTDMPPAPAAKPKRRRG